MIENGKLREEKKQLEIDKIHWRDLYREECEKKKKLEEENRNLRDEVKDLVERNIELDKKYMLVLTGNKNLKESYIQLEVLYGNNAEQYRELLEENRKLKAEIQEWLNAVGNK